VQILRAFFRAHHRLAFGVVALALVIKALVPAGYMPSGQARILTIAICADASSGQATKQIVVPSDGKSGERTKAEGACAWGMLAMAALGAADMLLLAFALAYILTLGLAPSHAAPPARAAFLRPPLRGPPAFA
jgi:hypothetical protein